MNSWKTDDKGNLAKATATRAICLYFENPANQAERALCTQVPATDESLKKTKEIFAREGQFYLHDDPTLPQGTEPIPQKAVIRVYEQDNRDDIVTIVLPTKGKLPEVPRFVARDFYRCSYWPY